MEPRSGPESLADVPGTWRGVANRIRGGASIRLGTPVVLGALLTGVALASPASVSAQEGCEFGNRGNDLVITQNLPGLGRVTYITRPHFLCAGGVQIFADSAVAYGDRGMSHLIGRVRYVESSRELRSDEARYFSNEGRLQANGHVSVNDQAQGSSIQNGDLVYLLKTDFRDREEMTVRTGADGMRPVAVLTPPPSDSADVGAPPGEPYTVVGDRIFLLGSGYFNASGTVEIVRDSLFAFADSAEYDQGAGSLLLEGSARVESATYELEGRTITMGTPGPGASEVHATRAARLVGDDLLLTSARIVLFLEDDELQRLVATPLARRDPGITDTLLFERPKANVQDFVLTADSLEVNAPNQTVERVFAAGRARSVSTSRDSLNVALLPEVARSDWLEGDTVVVLFRSPEARTLEGELAEVARMASGAPRDGELEVDSIIAIGGARSLYRLPPNDSTSRPGTDPPAVHYVVGDRITIQMAGREVDAMRVLGQTRGAHLEPLRAAPAAVPDTGSVAHEAGTASETRQGPRPVSEPSSEMPAAWTLPRPGPTPSSDPPASSPLIRPEPAADDRARLETS